jgi:phosphate transport system substrate-binding protein
MKFRTRRAVHAGRIMLALALALGASVHARADSLRFGGTGSAMGTIAALARAYKAVDPSFEIETVPNLGSTGGIKALQAGAIQIAAISRPLKPQEAADGLEATIYGRTPFVLATSEPGQRNVSLAELADLYAGHKTHWAPGRVIRLVLRPRTDGDVELLASFSPQMRAAQEAAHAREGMVVALTDQDAVDAIERLPGALGTASLALLSSEKRRATPLAIDGVEPTVANLASGRYPYAKTMLLVVRQDAPGAARRFVEFVRSDAGRKVLRDLGHAPPAELPAVAAR